MHLDPGVQAAGGPRWNHEIRLDGYRLIARKRDDRVQLFTRRGQDRTVRYPVICKAVAALRDRDGVEKETTLSIGHSFAAANRRSLFGAASRVLWLKASIILVFCIELIMSSHLWIGPRTYPVAPILSVLPSSIYPVDLFLFAALFALAVAIIVSAKPQKFIFAFLSIIIVFCLLDQTRWQPWVYQYAFLLAALAFFSWDSDDIAGRKRTVNVARLIVASTYVFSGLQKLNLNFMNTDFPWIVEPITHVLPAARTPLYALGIAAPFIQVVFGLGLLTRRYLRISLILAISMHAFVLAMFGPFGHNWNNIIWPWTAAMAVFDLVLFTGEQEFSVREMFWTNPYRYQVGVLALFAVLPILSFFNLWDSYLSSALYSGNLTEATIYATDEGRDSLPASLRAYATRTSPDTNVLNIQRWAIEDLNVTPYPETRVYKKIASCLRALTTSGGFRPAGPRATHVLEQTGDRFSLLGSVSRLMSGPGRTRMPGLNKFISKRGGWLTSIPTFSRAAANSKATRRQRAGAGERPPRP